MSVQETSSLPGAVDVSKLSVPTLPGVTPALPKSNSLWSSNPVFSYLNDVYTTISEHRKNLGLTNPGTIENLNKEVSRDVFLNQYFFTGLRADLNKAFSMSPAFQTSHTLSMGSQVLPPYAFSALYAADDFFLQGNIDNDMSFSGRINYGWDKANISKITLQLARSQPSMVQLEQDYQANDFSINLKTLNPNFLYGGFSGVAVASLLQSLTPKFALGLEAMYSKQPLSPPDTAVSYVARYNNDGKWIASAQIQAQGALIASFWRKVSDKVEAGLETQIAATMKQVADPLMGVGFEPVIDGTTTIGAKYEYRTAVFRGQLDSKGKVSAFLEKRILPTVSVLFSGEIDQFKNTSKLGLGLQFEAAGNEQLMLMQQGLIDANGNPVPGAPSAL
ncbi:TOM40 [Candida oxycetoniae]|uniref:Translocase of outer membrane 40 kDa subunit n=1 Tax=Candida oxycetoniae TaxID=497107 RepID=A0AAI9WZX0_9ASCO|nr:TOM40 [Candida oxycetoniae]KAI3406504.1 TOM40 [Candida oxycetoniae]